MSKLSFMDKLKILLEVSKSSYLYILGIIVLVVIGILFFKSNKQNEKKYKRIYIGIILTIIIYIIIRYQSSLGNMYEYMMDNLFIAIYFPNIAIYLAAIIGMNIILWISLFNYRTSESIKRLNIIIYLIMNYLLILILGIIQKEHLDVFTQNSVYTNEKATALIELSSAIFVGWIIFLILYKVILIYIRKDYKEKVKKVIIKKKVKKLPENYEPTIMPDFIYGKVGNIFNKKEVNLVPEFNSYNRTPQSNIMNRDEQLRKEFESMLTIDDYRLLLKLLKEQREKEQLQIQQEYEEQRRIEQELKERELEKERQRKEREYQEQLLRQEQLRIEAIKQQELEKEEEKFTELEMLYRSIR